MASCAFIKPDGTRCSAGTGAGSQWCYNHDPARAEERHRNARKGGKKAGRGRPVSELGALRVENGTLRARMLKGELEPRVVAVAVQSINTDIRAIEATLKARAQEELVLRLEDLESAEERRKQSEDRRTRGYRGA
jgi:hypothetical protein